jgi:uncharacterized protein involved in copper resistance
MLSRYRKVIAVLMLLWLPLFSGNALAATVSMQMHQSPCHEEMQAMDDMSMADMDMPNMSMSEMDVHHMPSNPHGATCSACGVCHLACAGYLAAPSAELASIQAAAREITPYLITFVSVSSAPLDPPPLVRA